MRSKLLVALFLSLSLAAVATAQSTKDESDLRALLNEFLAGASRNDAAVHDRFWADDLIYTRSAGVRINKDELMRGVRSAPQSKPGDARPAYAAEEIQIHLYGATAVVAFRLVATTTTKEGKLDVSNYLNTGTFVKRGGRWQAVAWQSTAVPRDQNR